MNCVNKATMKMVFSINNFVSTWNFKLIISFKTPQTLQKGFERIEI